MFDYYNCTMYMYILFYHLNYVTIKIFKTWKLKTKSVELTNTYNISKSRMYILTNILT